MDVCKRGRKEKFPASLFDVVHRLAKEGANGFFLDAGEGGKFLDGDEGKRVFAELFPDPGEELAGGALAQAGDVGDILRVNHDTRG